MKKLCLTCGTDIESGKYCEVCNWKNKINERTIKTIKNQRKTQTIQTTFDKSHNEIAEIVYKLIEENEKYRSKNEALEKRCEILTIENERLEKDIRKNVRNENVCNW